MLDRLIQKHKNKFLNSSHYPNPSRPPDNFILIDQHGIVLSTKDEIVDRGVCVFAYLDLRCYKRVQTAIKIGNADTPTIINVQYNLHGVPYDSEIHILKHSERYLGIIWRTPNLIAFNPRKQKNLIQMDQRHHNKNSYRFRCIYNILADSGKIFSEAWSKICSNKR